MQPLVSNALLVEIFSKSREGTAIYVSEDLHIGFINDAMLRIWHKCKDIIGMPLMKAAPEFEEFVPILKEVWRTGKIYIAKETPANIMINGEVAPTMFDFEYRPVLDAHGNTYAIINTATDITERLAAEKVIQERDNREQQLNEELLVTNNELAAINEEMILTNKRLIEIQREHRTLIDRLEESEERLIMAISSADLGIWRMEVVNRQFEASPRMRELFGYQAEEPMSYQSLLDGVTQDYRHKVLNAIETAILQEGILQLEFTIRSKDEGRLRWLKANGKVFKDPAHDLAYFSGIIDDITERKTDEIRKNDFISIVSHEFKTPITAIKGYLQLIKRQSIKPEHTFTEQMATKAIISVAKMEAMVKGFLNVARFGSGKLYLDKQDFDINDVLKQSVEENKTIGYAHTFSYTPSEKIIVHGDKDKIEHVVSNLLSNAIKYSAEGTTVTVNCNAVGDVARVKVRDEGIGIKEEDAKRLFERFYRVDDPHNVRISGFGIGLYLCWEIIQRHEGRIWVESAEGNGSTFFFEIPLLNHS